MLNQARTALLAHSWLLIISPVSQTETESAGSPKLKERKACIKWPFLACRKQPNGL